MTPAPDTAAARKSRGAFFTPHALARHVTDWAVRDVGDKILEPSCGEAAFLLAAVRRLAALRESTGTGGSPQLDGVELHEASAAEARAMLLAAEVDADIHVGDFFAHEPTGSYDVVIGNPPYVRYQDFDGESRRRSRVAALRAGVNLTGLASSWAAFTVHAALFLKKGGRLGLVLPAELLSVNYASAVRRFLLERFARVDLVVFQERVFPEVLEEVVLLLAEGYLEGPAEHCVIHHARNAEALPVSLEARWWRPNSPDGKWTPSLLSAESSDAYLAVLQGQGFTTLQTWGDTTLGMVTGNNRYFALPPARVAELGLEPTDVVPLSPPGSRHLRGLSLTSDALRALGHAGSPTSLFRPATTPSPAAAEYIRAGESTGVDTAYKCRVRKPWWRVPLVRPADILLTYMNADTPRLATNSAQAHHLNSVHGLYLKPDHRRIGVDLLPLATLNSMTLLGAETVGRAYGGGMLKLEPREADLLPVPTPELLKGMAPRLVGLRPRVQEHLHAGRLLAAVHLVDDLLLVTGLGLSRNEVAVLRGGHAQLAARRLARGVPPGA